MNSFAVEDLSFFDTIEEETRAGTAPVLPVAASSQRIVHPTASSSPAAGPATAASPFAFAATPAYHARLLAYSALWWTAQQLPSTEAHRAARRHGKPSKGSTDTLLCENRCESGPLATKSADAPPLGPEHTPVLLLAHREHPEVRPLVEQVLQFQKKLRRKKQPPPGTAEAEAEPPCAASTGPTRSPAPHSGSAWRSAPRPPPSAEREPRSTSHHENHENPFVPSSSPPPSTSPWRSSSPPLVSSQAAAAATSALRKHCTFPLRPPLFAAVSSSLYSPPRTNLCPAEDKGEAKEMPLATVPVPRAMSLCDSSEDDTLSKLFAAPSLFDQMKAAANPLSVSEGVQTAPATLPAEGHAIASACHSTSGKERQHMARRTTAVDVVSPSTTVSRGGAVKWRTSSSSAAPPLVRTAVDISSKTAELETTQSRQRLSSPPPLTAMPQSSQFTFDHTANVPRIAEDTTPRRSASHPMLQCSAPFPTYSASSTTPTPPRLLSPLLIHPGEAVEEPLTPPLLEGALAPSTMPERDRREAGTPVQQTPPQQERAQHQQTILLPLSPRLCTAITPVRGTSLRLQRTLFALHTSRSVEKPCESEGMARPSPSTPDRSTSIDLATQCSHRMECRPLPFEWTEPASGLENGKWVGERVPSHEPPPSPPSHVSHSQPRRTTMQWGSRVQCGSRSPATVPVCRTGESTSPLPTPLFSSAALGDPVAGSRTPPPPQSSLTVPLKDTGPRQRVPPPQVFAAACREHSRKRLRVDATGTLDDTTIQQTADNLQWELLLDFRERCHAHSSGRGPSPSPPPAALHPSAEPEPSKGSAAHQQFVSLLAKEGIPCRSAALPAGDVMWAVNWGHPLAAASHEPEQPHALSVVVERKTLADLEASVKSARYVQQRHALSVTSAFRVVLWIVEGPPDFFEAPDTRAADASNRRYWAGKYRGGGHWSSRGRGGLRARRDANQPERSTPKRMDRNPPLEEEEGGEGEMAVGAEPRTDLPFSAEQRLYAACASLSLHSKFSVLRTRNVQETALLLRLLSQHFLRALAAWKLQHPAREGGTGDGAALPEWLAGPLQETLERVAALQRQLRAATAFPRLLQCFPGCSSALALHIAGRYGDMLHLWRALHPRGTLPGAEEEEESVEVWRDRCLAPAQRRTFFMFCRFLLTWAYTCSSISGSGAAANNTRNGVMRQGFRVGLLRTASANAERDTTRLSECRDRIPQLTIRLVAHPTHPKSMGLPPIHNALNSGMYMDRNPPSIAAWSSRRLGSISGKRGTSREEILGPCNSVKPLAALSRTYQ